MNERRALLAFAFICFAAAILTACTRPAADRPGPIVRTVEVQVPVVQACPALDRLGPPPTYPDTGEAVRAAPNLYAKVQLIMAGRALRIGRLVAVEAALEVCGRGEEGVLQEP